MEFAGIALIMIISVVLTIIKLKGGSKTHSEEEHTQEEIIRQRQAAMRQPEQNNEMVSMRSFDQRARQTAFRDIKQKDEVRGAKSLGHHQSHCDVDNHSFSDRYRVEKVPVMNSIGGKSTEGCQEHYDVRFVKEDREEKKEGLRLNELQRAMVLGEVLNNPAFKRNGYRKIR